jgi:hypothetical protein
MGGSAVAGVMVAADRGAAAVPAAVDPTPAPSGGESVAPSAVRSRQAGTARMGDAATGSKTDTDEPPAGEPTPAESSAAPPPGDDDPAGDDGD